MISGISVGFIESISTLFSVFILAGSVRQLLSISSCGWVLLNVLSTVNIGTLLRHDKGLAWLVITDCSFKHGTKVKGLSVRETTNGHQHLSASDMSALSEYGDVQEKGEDKSDEQDTVLIRTLERALSGTERAAAAKLESASGDC